MKYVLSILVALTLLTLVSGCGIILPPLKLIKQIFVSKPKPKETFVKEDLTLEEIAERQAWCAKYGTKTVEQKVRSLLGLGATAGIVAVVIPALLLIFSIWSKVSMNKGLLIKIIVLGAALVIISITLDKYLIPIMVTGIILVGLIAGYYTWRHRKKLMKWANFTDELKRKGGLNENQIHAAATKTIGEAGCKDREEIKETANSVRT